MKKYLWFTFAASLLLFSQVSLAQSKKALQKELAACKAKLDSLDNSIIPKQDLTSLKDSFSYALGVDLYESNLVPQGLDKEINIDALYIGMKSAEMGEDSMGIDERQNLIESVFEGLNAKKQVEDTKRRKEMEQMAKSNLAKGEIFLSENRNKPDVVSLKNGLQYKVLKQGNSFGSSPTPNSSVTVNYEGKFIDGTVFESTFNGSDPVTFPVNGVISGWTEILQQMHVGDTWEVYIPSHMAYGPNGNGGIAPNETLIFIIELLEINNQ